MNNMGGNKLLIFLVGAIAGGLVVYSASSPRMRSLAARAAGKGIQLKNDAAALIESIKENAEDFAAEAKHYGKKGSK